MSSGRAPVGSAAAARERAFADFLVSVRDGPLAADGALGGGRFGAVGVLAVGPLAFAFRWVLVGAIMVGNTRSDDAVGVDSSGALGVGGAGAAAALTTASFAGAALRAGCPTS
jgi:hypothetical protein